MSQIAKIYERILEKRVRTFVENRLSERQCGFRPNRSTIDQISALRLYLEKKWEYNQDQHLCFLDLEKAFDRVPRHQLWETLREYGIPEHLLRAIKSTYKDQKSKIIGGDTFFNISTGVRQGSVLSPILFVIYMD